MCRDRSQDLSTGGLESEGAGPLSDQGRELSLYAAPTPRGSVGRTGSEIHSLVFGPDTRTHFP